MKVTCDYCGSNIDDTLDKCPNCGAVNKHMMRSGDQIPKTIEELKKFIEDKNIPVEKMRFFIGEDYKQPKAFGIYKNDTSGIVTVYKNKANGERAVRYQGDDEAYAVNEIYQKMRSELLERKQADLNKPKAVPRPAGTHPKDIGGCLTAVVTIAVVMLVIFFILISIGKHPITGYYSYDGDRYYNNNNSWYMAADDGAWIRTDAPEELTENYSDYYECKDYSSLDDGYQDEVEEFPTEAYDSGNDNDNWADDNWDDDDWDYDYDTYDYGDSDWDSDW